VVIEVFVARSKTENPLAQRFLDRVFDQFFGAKIGEASGQPADNTGVIFDLAKQQPACVGGHRPPSNRAVNSRRPTASKANVCWIHCVCIGCLLRPGKSVVDKHTFAKGSTRLL